MSHPESFLRRWSRLKIQSASPDVVPAVVTAAEMAGPDSDLGALLHPEVKHDVRQAALRKLFMTDHYRVMDGLDVYVDDYSHPELLSAELLERLDHARGLLSRNGPEQEAPPLPPAKQEPPP